MKAEGYEAYEIGTQPTAVLPVLTQTQQNKCLFMLEQLSGVDKRLGELVSQLDSVYLSMDQAVELKAYRTQASASTEQFKEFVMYAAKEELGDDLRGAIEEAKRAVARLRREAKDSKPKQSINASESTNTHTLRLLAEELEQQYAFESNMLISGQKQLNRGLQQVEVIKLKVTELEARESQLGVQEEQAREAAKTAVDQKRLAKIYEGLLERRHQLVRGREHFEDNNQNRIKTELSKLTGISSRIAAQDYYIKQIEQELAEQRLVISELKQQQGLTTNPQPTAEQKYFLQLYQQKARNHYISKFLGEGRRVELQLPNHPVRIRHSYKSKSPPQKNLNSISKTAERVRTEFNFVSSDEKQAYEGTRVRRRPSSFDKSPHDKLSIPRKHRRAVNLSNVQLPEIKVVRRQGNTDRKDRQGANQKEYIKIQQSKAKPKGNSKEGKKKKKRSSESSSNSHSEESSSEVDNIFKPVKITKYTKVIPKVQPEPVEQESEESQNQQLFTKPVIQQKRKKPQPQPQISKPEQRTNTQSSQDGKITDKFPVRIQRHQPTNYDRPNIDLIMERTVRIESSLSDVSRMTPLRKEQPKQLPEPKVQEYRPPPPKITPQPPVVKPHKRPKQRGVFFQAEGYEESFGDPQLSRVSSDFEPSLSLQTVGLIPQYTAEELGVQPEQL